MSVVYGLAALVLLGLSYAATWLHEWPMAIVLLLAASVAGIISRQTAPRIR